jgi:hypothetical protein
MMFKLGDIFRIEEKKIGYISGLYAKGFHYHTLNERGKCIEGQQYMLKVDFINNKDLNLGR